MNFQSALLLSRKFTEVLASQASPPHPTFTYWVQFRRRRHVDGVERDYVAVSVRKDTERAIDEHERLCGFEHLDDAHEASNEESVRFGWIPRLRVLFMVE